ncbi:uncharacterized protein LOC131249489 [Magnolia sinica]|uniref:uncharacterized protein LOC131249489 n=1 Tax=Magnolia sinica TaxID=86752 RepID=UPI002658B48C|nr:uncharacterized protein LOC131249489 [Magnolia sinica]
MAMVMDEQQSFKHYCRICKKGFGCGRALGGHMRAHGIGDELSHADDDDLINDWEDKLGGNPQSGNKRMYALRTNPNRLKSCRICRNCGKEFLSWKSFLEHGKCSSDDAEESLVSSPESDDEDRAGWKDCCGWSKGKRSRRVVKMGNFNMNCPSSEEEELANWLVMLSAARVDPMVVEPEESCASASKEEERQRNWPVIVADSSRALVEKTKSATKGMFECKACKKVFSSHQALGGHRASHKKVKGCFAAKLDGRDESLIEEDVITHDEFSIPSKSTIMPLNHVDHTTLTIPSKRKSKVHECSICHRIFTSGQALGGHKRCHWVTSNCPDTSVARFHQLQNHSQHLHKKPMLNKSEPLDLNMPAPVDEMGGPQMDTENPLSFQVPMAIYLQQWIGLNSNNNNNNNNKSSSMAVAHVDDEAESKIKLAKLSELKDMNMGSGSSPWLQVGIGSTASGSGGRYIESKLEEGERLQQYLHLPSSSPSSLLLHHLSAMEKHTCKLCSRSFSNGRALGGHMRSHVSPLPPSPQARKIQVEEIQNENEYSSSSSSSSSEEEEQVEEEEDEGKSLYYGLRENPKKSFRLVDPEFSFAADAGCVVQDRESETESSKNPVRHRRSKRQRRSTVSELNLKVKPKRELELEPEPLSSVSDTIPEEDVALCLMMLSRDIWMRDSSIKAFEESEEENEEEEEEEEEESPEELKFRPRRRSKHQCGTCKKVFRSYQALGGHRASHKKIKGCSSSSVPSPPPLMKARESIPVAGNVGPTDHQRIHQCPVCFRVFRSGQALGGHKRSHLTASASSPVSYPAPPAPAIASPKFADSFIDLNLPAPIEDDDMVSAVSDAEFIDLPK